MELVNITEYNGVGPIPNEPAVARQDVVDISESFSDQTKLIRVIALADCKIVIGENPVLEYGATILSAGEEYYCNILPAREHKLIVEPILL